ncbi:shTK domain protein [Ancylostoma caninum]|uniref:ShTK domain protein n=1 Tax=Ancylostoma caninum TaxID=29170 RepID=A0A368G9I1_ANCCA|nr:shTK domain protein [Ancylostoma caninum]
MLQIFVFTALLCGSYAAITDLNCTHLVGNDRKYDASALNCPNKYPDDDCAKLFPGNEVKVDMDDERPDNCFKYPGLRELAITACSKRCGYCCINPAYNCKDKPNPRISCQVITPDMCVSPYWKNIIAEDCPTACGFCQTPIGDCADRAAGCGNDLSICINIYMQDFVKENCKKTCGFCSQGGGGGSTADCGNDPKCPNWVQNGFCASTFYTAEQKKKYCGKLCKLC